MKFLGRVWTCVFAAAIVARLPAEGASRVQLRRGGYEDVVIAISPEVQESPELISAIKSKVKVASELLFAASRSTVFFRKVTLLLPKKWTNVAADSVANDISYEDSDIRVAPAHPAYADQPFTLQPGGCGSPGMFSHFTSKLFTDTNLSDVWGPPERLLVLEWAKLRWGVFEELGYRDDPIFPLFYRPDLDAEDDGTDEVEDDEGGDNVGGEKSSVEEEEGEEGEVSMAGDVKGEKDKAKEKRTKFVANLCAPGSLEGRYV
ncbi:calcium-activated chloride channel regulator family member 3-like [Penaeus japonicus]|uniref:calcium-activated chloride channel regulator family member 3-like n=1 Tax=Penaeus japonicus TaxID=27405 RepID=UPI001C70F299|nr:calcium-activated chloride channel regulator family member 3-like [Penaeus japonicus]